MQEEEESSKRAGGGAEEEEVAEEFGRSAGDGADSDEKDEQISTPKASVRSMKGSEIEEDGDERLIRAQKLLEDERKKSEDYLTRLRYLQADFENHRKRVEREIRELEDFSVSALMKRLLPVLDDLELATSTAEKDKETRGFAEGVGMIYKNLASVLRSEGLEAIDAIGKPFDPERHEAVERVAEQGDGAGKGQDIVVGEVRRGYIFKDRVLRPSMVKVGFTMKKEEETTTMKTKKSELQE